MAQANFRLILIHLTKVLTLYAQKQSRRDVASECEPLNCVLKFALITMQNYEPL